MHSAKLENSDRLQKVYDVLQTGPKTTMQIIQQAKVCAVSTIIKELRDNGIPVAPAECIGKGIYRYRLEKLF